MTQQHHSAEVDTLYLNISPLILLSDPRTLIVFTGYIIIIIPCSNR